MFVAAVDLTDVVDAARSLGAHGSYQQGDAGADVGAGHSSGMQLSLMVMAHDDGTMWVAQDNLRPHVDEFIDEEQAALEHLLVDEYRTLGLSAHDEEHAQKVGRQARPGRVGQRHERAVEEGLYLVVVVARDEDVVALLFHADAQTAEGGRDDAQVVVADIVYADAIAHHRSHADERAHLDHVGQDGVFGAAQRRYALDGEQVAADAGDAGSHAHEHLA